MISQIQILLKGYPKGFHLVTSEILSHLQELPCQGLLNLFIQHTSAAITINENADPTVRQDFNSFFSKLVPETNSYFIHTYEGMDDMPAHIKSSLLGQSITIPISNHRLALGTWQGIYLCEFRNHTASRKILATIIE